MPFNHIVPWLRLHGVMLKSQGKVIACMRASIGGVKAVPPQCGRDSLRTGATSLAGCDSVAHNPVVLQDRHCHICELGQARGKGSYSWQI